MKKMNESLQRMINAGSTAINSNKIVLYNTAVLAPVMVGQKIVDISSYKSVKLVGSFNKKVTVKKVTFGLK